MVLISISENNNISLKITSRYESSVIEERDFTRQIGIPGGIWISSYTTLKKCKPYVFFHVRHNHGFVSISIFWRKIFVPKVDIIMNKEYGKNCVLLKKLKKNHED